MTGKSPRRRRQAAILPVSPKNTWPVFWKRANMIASEAIHHIRELGGVAKGRDRHRSAPLLAGSVAANHQRQYPGGRSRRSFPPSRRSQFPPRPLDLSEREWFKAHLARGARPSCRKRRRQPDHRRGHVHLFAGDPGCGRRSGRCRPDREDAALLSAGSLTERSGRRRGIGRLEPSGRSGRPHRHYA